MVKMLRLAQSVPMIAGSRGMEFLAPLRGRIPSVVFGSRRTGPSESWSDVAVARSFDELVDEAADVAR
jgi:hypothetical protein